MPAWRSKSEANPSIQRTMVSLAAQMARTGSLLTAAEKTEIVEFMKHPLQIEDIPNMFENA